MLQMGNTTMQGKFGKPLILRQWVNTMIFKSDVLLLADVLESFRKTCLQYYKLDPCHYFTSLGLSWDAMLKMTNIKLELMTNVDMFQFI